MNLQNRAAVLYGTGDLRVEDVAMPEPAADEVLVEIRAVGVCGSDVHYYREGRIGSHAVEEPLVLGHETSGVIIGRGERATRHAVGTRVALEPGVPDRRCAQCRAGRYNLCPNVRFFATPPVDGTFTRYQTIHEDFAFPLPDALSDEAGALIEPLSVGLWAADKGGVTPGDRVLVTGAGPVGLLALQVALARGATQAIVTDVNPARLKVATELGATDTVAIEASEPGLDDPGPADPGPADPGLADLGADVLLECSGVPSALGDGIAALRPGAIAVAVGMSAAEAFSVPVGLLQQREIWLTGTFRYANTYPTAIALATRGHVVLDRLVTHRFPLDEAERALTVTAEDPDALKPVVLPSRQ